MFNTSDETAEITKALVTAQLEMPAAVSNKRGYEKHQSNDVSGKKPRVYADINAVLRAVRPTLSQHGIAIAGETIDDDAEDAQFGVKEDGAVVTLKKPKGYDAWQKSLLNMTSAKDLAKAFRDAKASPQAMRQFLAATQETWFTDHRTKLEANDADV